MRFIKGLFLALLFIFSISYSSDIVYVVKIQGLNDFSGAYDIKENGNNLKVSFINLSKNDRLPFFANSKETIINNNRGEKFIIDGKSYVVLYDLTKLRSFDLRRLGVIRTKDKKIAIKLNGNYKYTLDKLPVINFEILVALLNQNKINSGNFYLFEPQNNLIIKIKLQKKGNSNINSCNYEKYILYMETPNREIPILNIYKKGKVEYIEANSKKWALYLTNYGNQKNIKENIYNISKVAVKSDIEKISTTLSKKLKLSNSTHNIEGVDYNYKYIDDIQINNDIIRKDSNISEAINYNIKIEENDIKLTFNPCDNIKENPSLYSQYFFGESSSDEEQEQTSYNFDFSNNCSSIKVKFDKQTTSEVELLEEEIKDLFNKRYFDIQTVNIKENKALIDRFKIGDEKDNITYSIEVKLKPKKQLFIDIVKSFINELDIKKVITDKDNKVVVIVNKNYFKSIECDKIKNKLSNELSKTTFYLEDILNNKVKGNKCEVNNITFHIPLSYIKENAKSILLKKYPLIKWYNKNQIKLDGNYLTFKIPNPYENCLLNR